MRKPRSVGDAPTPAPGAVEAEADVKAAPKKPVWWQALDRKSGGEFRG